MSVMPLLPMHYNTNTNKQKAPNAIKQCHRAAVASECACSLPCMPCMHLFPLSW